MKKLLIITLILSAGFILPARAEIPQTLNYQGVLTDAGGSAVPDGYYSITFRLYDVPSGGTAPWTETNMVQVSKGIFSVVLGTLEQLNLPFDTDYYLGMSVEGEAELSPRVVLTSSAYALNSRGVTGIDNVFPPTGKVGVGTALPTNAFHVRADASSEIAMKVEGNHPTHTAIYVNAMDPSSTSGIGFCRGALKVKLFADVNDHLRFRIGSAEHVIFRSDGRVGIGTLMPVETLDINGGIRIGDALASNAGTIRWSGADFEGYDGSSWKSFTDTGSGTVPSGSSGQTLRNNGSSWVTASNLYNDGTNVGIGTTSPNYKLHVSSSSIYSMRVEGTAIGSWAGIQINAAGLGSNPSIFYYRQGLQKVTSYVDGGGKWNILIDGDDRLTVEPNGDVGIGTDSPEEKLHVAGDSQEMIKVETSASTGRSGLELKTTGGIYDNLSIIKHSPSASGTTAGSIPLANLARVAAGTQGGPLMLQVTNLNPMYFVTDNEVRMLIDSDGETGIGTTTPDAKLDVTCAEATKVLDVVSSYSGSLGNVVNIQRTVIVPSNNDMLQIMVADGSADDFQFIECQRSADVKFKVEGNGNVFADGSYTSPAADFAEMIAVSSGASRVEPGDVLVIDSSNPRSTVKSVQPRSTLVAGIYSTKPGFIGSERDWDKPIAGGDGENIGTYTLGDMAAEFNEIPLAVVGIVPCKVSAENGAIRPGDLLVTSDTPGHAMRDDDPKVGTVLGKALGSLTSGTGVIKVLVTLN